MPKRVAEPKVPTQLWLDPPMRAALALIEKQEDRSMGELIRVAVAVYLSANYRWALDVVTTPVERLKQERAARIAKREMESVRALARLTKVKA